MCKYNSFSAKTNYTLYYPWGSKYESHVRGGEKSELSRGGNPPKDEPRARIGFLLTNMHVGLYSECSSLHENKIRFVRLIYSCLHCSDPYYCVSSSSGRKSARRRRRRRLSIFKRRELLRNITERRCLKKVRVYDAHV